jgi:hypothetical protein
MPNRSVIRFNSLNYLALFACSDSASPPFGSQKGEVKRLCRGGDTLLSRPGQVQRGTSPIAAVRGDFQSAAKRFKAAKRSGFRDVHASKGSNRA